MSCGDASLRIPAKTKCTKCDAEEAFSIVLTAVNVGVIAEWPDGWVHKIPEGVLCPRCNRGDE